MNKTLLALVLVSAAALLRADPVITSVEMASAPDGKTATITYALSGAPAIVTLDILKDGVPLSNKVWRVSGDVNREVSASSGTIVWDCGADWPESASGVAGVTAKVTAYAKSNPPKYMVVSLAGYPEDGRVAYYEDEYLIPGGVHDPMYKTSKVVMRHIPARGVTWTMGSPSDEKGRLPDETQHDVTMSNDYWMAVYPTTACQSQMGGGSWGQPVANFDLPMRPCQRLQWTAIRNADSEHTPDAPSATSILGKFRDLTGLDFDLPSEAQWEFACRAGNYGSTWGDGSAILSDTKDDNLANMARYRRNSGFVWTTTWVDPSANTLAKDGHMAIVGSYKPNSWGLYDMHGNCAEWCLDCYQTDITGLGGAVCTNETLSGGSVKRVFRGGMYSADAWSCRAARRFSDKATNQWNGLGTYRLVCQGGIPRGLDAPVVAPSACVSAAVAIAARGATAGEPAASGSAIDTLCRSSGVIESLVNLLNRGLYILFR